MPDDQLTTNFRRSEFACHCGCGLDSIDLELVAGLQLLRDVLGKPIHVLSGCRCAKHNRSKDVGGAANSRHILPWCDAVDVTCPGVPIRQVYQEAARIPVFKGFGLDDQRNMLHLDKREEMTRWVYLGGKAVPCWPTGLEPVQGIVGVPA